MNCPKFIKCFFLFGLIFFIAAINSSCKKENDSTVNEKNLIPSTVPFNYIDQADSTWFVNENDLNVNIDCIVRVIPNNKGGFYFFGGDFSLGTSNPGCSYPTNVGKITGDFSEAWNKKVADYEAYRINDIGIDSEGNLTVVGWFIEEDETLGVFVKIYSENGEVINEYFYKDKDGKYTETFALASFIDGTGNQKIVVPVSTFLSDGQSTSPTYFLMFDEQLNDPETLVFEDVNAQFYDVLSKDNYLYLFGYSNEATPFGKGHFVAAYNTLTNTFDWNTPLLQEYAFLYRNERASKGEMFFDENNDLILSFMAAYSAVHQDVVVNVNSSTGNLNYTRISPGYKASSSTQIEFGFSGMAIYNNNVIKCGVGDYFSNNYPKIHIYKGAQNDFLTIIAESLIQEDFGDDFRFQSDLNSPLSLTDVFVSDEKLYFVARNWPHLKFYEINPAFLE